MPKTREIDFDPTEIRKLLRSIRTFHDTAAMGRLAYILRNIPETKREKLAAFTRTLAVRELKLLLGILKNMWTTEEEQEKRYGPQRRRLTALMKQASKWSVMVYVERPGDVACLISICPQLEGYEIVAASEDGTYDIWLDGNLTDDHSLTIEQMVAWLKDRLPPEVEIEANVVAWATHTMERLRLEEAATQGGVQ